MAEGKDQQESVAKRSTKKAAKADGTLTPASGGQSHAALARKYRPKLFSELIGQDAMVQTLRNAFASGRIAQAYMLTGVRGVGKTTTARLIARALNYVPRGGEGAPTLDMTEEGEHCRAILESRHLDVVEMDAASHTGIDDIRDLIDSAHYKPNTARYKVYIIDEVHMLSKQAFNGLLKTLEEPPEHVKFIFATTEARKVPVTVLSRCQRFDLKRIEVEQLAEHLAGIVAQENATADPAALMLIARAAEGSVRDALSILDRAIAFGSGKVEAGSLRGLLGLADRGRVFDLLETVLAGDAGNALAKLSGLINDGAEPAQAITDLADAVHAVTLVKAAGTSDPASSEAERASAADLAKRLSMPVLARAWQMLLKGHEEVKSSARPHAAADMVLVRLAYAADLPTPGDLMRRLGDNSGEGEGAPRAMPNRQAPREPAPAMRREAQTPAGAGTIAGRRDGRPRSPRASAVARQSEELRGGGGARRGEARFEAQARAHRAGATRALPSRPSRAQSARHRAEGARPGPDAQAESLDRPGVDRGLERRRRRSAAGGAAPRARGPRDRAHPRSPRCQASAATFPRRAYRRGASDRKRGAPGPPGRDR